MCRVAVDWPAEGEAISPALEFKLLVLFSGSSFWARSCRAPICLVLRQPWASRREKSLPSPRRPEKPDAPRSPSDIAAACLAVQAERGWVYGEPRAENMRSGSPVPVSCPQLHRSLSRVAFFACRSLGETRKSTVASCSPDSTRAVVDRRVMRLRQTPESYLDVSLQIVDISHPMPGVL